MLALCALVGGAAVRHAMPSIRGRGGRRVSRRPQSAIAAASGAGTDTAVFAGGCFWVYSCSSTSRA